MVGRGAGVAVTRSTMVRAGAAKGTGQPSGVGKSETVRRGESRTVRLLRKRECNTHKAGGSGKRERRRSGHGAGGWPGGGDDGERGDDERRIDGRDDRVDDGRMEECSGEWMCLGVSCLRDGVGRVDEIIVVGCLFVCGAPPCDCARPSLISVMATRCLAGIVNRDSTLLPTWRKSGVI